MDAAQPGNVWTVGKVPDFPDEIRRYKFWPYFPNWKELSIWLSNWSHEVTTTRPQLPPTTHKHHPVPRPKLHLSPHPGPLGLSADKTVSGPRRGTMNSMKRRTRVCLCLCSNMILSNFPGFCDCYVTCSYKDYKRPNFLILSTFSCRRQPSGQPRPFRLSSHKTGSSDQGDVSRCSDRVRSMTDRDTEAQGLWLVSATNGIRVSRFSESPEVDGEERRRETTIAGVYTNKVCYRRRRRVEERRLEKPL